MEKHEITSIICLQKERFAIIGIGGQSGIVPFSYIRYYSNSDSEKITYEEYLAQSSGDLITEFNMKHNAVSFVFSDNYETKDHDIDSLLDLIHKYTQK